MQIKRIQNRLFESRLLLPCVLILLCVLWWFPKMDVSWFSGAGLLLCLFITYVIMEMSNVNALIRVYTRGVSSLFVLLLTSTGFLHEFAPALWAVGLLSVAYYLFLRADIVANQIVCLFHVFVALGIGVLIMPLYAAFVPMFFLYCIAFFRRLSWRAFFAGLIGLLLPFGTVVSMAWFMEDWTWIQCWLEQVFMFRLPDLQDYATLRWEEVYVWILLIILALRGSSHYLRHCYEDKVRTRMLMYVFISQSTVIALLALLQPRSSLGLLPAMMLSVSPPMAHYFTLRRTVFATIWLWLLCMALLFLLWATCWPVILEVTMQEVKNGALMLYLKILELFSSYLF